MSRYISETIRISVAKKANFRCEYCRIYERYATFAFHIDHIISIKHGGSSDESNLAYSCRICNFNKGTDIATLNNDSSKLIRFFNPRKEKWGDHFKVNLSGVIIPLTDIGKATQKIFNLNHPDSILERELMLKRDLF